MMSQESSLGLLNRGLLTTQSATFCTSVNCKDASDPSSASVGNGECQLPGQGKLPRLWKLLFGHSVWFCRYQDLQHDITQEET